jgi:hypothetical protein
MEIIQLLLKPELLAVLGPIGTVLLGVLIFTYRQYTHFRDKYEEQITKNDTLEEKRVDDIRQMNREYFQLASEVEKTLDILISVIKNRRNGGNGASHND